MIRILLLGVAAFAAAWAAGSELDWPARALMGTLVGPMPAFAVLQARQLAQSAEWPSRMQLYFSTIFGLWGLAFATAVAATESGFTPRILGVTPIGWTNFALWLMFAMAGIAALVVAAKALGLRETPVLAHMIPQTRTEKAVYIGVSLTAGICEELIFRGFLIAALFAATGSMTAAVLIAALAFGLAHAHQDTRGALRAGSIALLLSVPLVMSGSLYPGIAAHAIADLVAGLWLSRWLVTYE